MRANLKLPRIVKINWIDELSISVQFNNFENRIIDFRKILLELNVTKESPAYILFDEKEFRKVALNNNTLSWTNVNQFITLKNNKRQKVSYEIGADVLFRKSKPEKSEFTMKLGKLIKDHRLSSGLTIRELAIMSGTSASTISKIENFKNGVNIETVEKIFLLGFGKKMDLSFK